MIAKIITCILYCLIGVLGILSFFKKDNVICSLVFGTTILVLVVSILMGEADEI